MFKYTYNELYKLLIHIYKMSLIDQILSDLQNLYQESKKNSQLK